MRFAHEMTTPMSLGCCRRGGQQSQVHSARPAQRLQPSVPIGLEDPVAPFPNPHSPPVLWKSWPHLILVSCLKDTWGSGQSPGSGARAVSLALMLFLWGVDHSSPSNSGKTRHMLFFLFKGRLSLSC